MLDQTSGHCTNLAADRKLGAEWDVRFCTIAADYGKLFTPHQIGRKTSAAAYYRDNGERRRVILPDITIWSSPGEHHEIKHKVATKTGYYGLEEYRLHSLREFADRTEQRVYYTIHDWTRAGKWAVENDPRDWITCELSELYAAIIDRSGPYRNWGSSWVGGVEKRVPIWFWPVGLWVPLTSVWQ